MNIPRATDHIDVYPHDDYVPMSPCFEGKAITAKTLESISRAINACDWFEAVRGETTQAMREDRERLLQQAEICLRGLRHG